MSTGLKTPAIAIATFLTLAAGCGGTREPAPAPASAPVQDEEPGDVLIPPEKLDEIQRFFDRKRRIVTRCFVKAIETGELPNRARGHVTVAMTISAAGKPTAVKVADSDLESETLHECVLDYVTRWTLTSLPKPLDYTYTFAFDTL